MWILLFLPVVIVFDVSRSVQLHSPNWRQFLAMAMDLVVLVARWLVVTAGLVAAFLVYGSSPVKRWRLRKMPGDFPLPLLGHLPAVMKLGGPMWIMGQRARHGRIFQMWFGRTSMIVLTDPEHIRMVGTKLLNHPQFPSIITEPRLREVEVNGLLPLRDNAWRTARSAWTPVFSPTSLHVFIDLMNHCAEQLVARLDKVAAEGATICLWRELGNMTLAVVGTTAYGVDFDTMNESAQSSPYGSKLVTACQDFFKYSSVARGSKYGRVVLLAPELRRLVFWLANKVPDLPMKSTLQARWTLYRVCSSLIDAWKLSHAPTSNVSGLLNGDVSIMSRMDAKPAQNGHSSSSMAALNGHGQGKVDGAAAAVDGSVNGRAMQPQASSFLSLVLEARSKTSGEKLTDAQVVAQCQTFILAGYETTATALAFTVHFLSCNPHAEAALLKEVDAFGRDKAVSSEHLAQFPYCEAAFNESLRLKPPAHATNRDATTDMVVGGQVIPKGTFIFLSIFAVHHDPAIWPRCEEYLPERFLPGGEELAAKVPNAFIPFGVGPRMCVGWKFAIQEAKIALIRLYQRFTFELEAGQVPLQVVNGITLVPKHGVFVKPVLRT